MQKLTIALSLAVVGLAPLGADRAFAASSISANFSRQVKLTLNGTATGCDNTGSTVDISGSLALGDVGVVVTLQNNTRGTHGGTFEQMGTLEITPATAVSIPKQPVRGGVGGNPKIWARILDDEGNPLTGYLFFGRCVQGASLNTLEVTLAVPAVAEAFFSSLECSNRGTSINIDSSSNSGGVNAELVFTNNDKFTHKAGPYDATAGLELTAPITAPKAGNLENGVTGNPIVYGNFKVDGVNLTDPIRLTRCNKL